MSAVDAWIVSNWNEVALWLGSISSASRHESSAECNISTLCPKWIFIRCKVRSANRTHFVVLEPSNQFLDPVQWRDGIVIGEQHKFVVHLSKGKVASVGTVARRVVDPRGAVLLAHGLGVVFGFGIRDDDFEMRVGLLAQALKHDVKFVGVVDGGDQHGRLVRRTVLFEQNGDRFTFAHGAGDTPAS